VIKLVMTGTATDPVEFCAHVRSKSRQETLRKRYRKADDPLKLVIVCDMWLTGFDAPVMHTLYIDKPMKGQILMQAIARVNRVFRDKPAGLVVDYICLAADLKVALAHYSASDRSKTGVDTHQATLALLTAIDVLWGMFSGVGYQAALAGSGISKQFPVPAPKVAVCGSGEDIFFEIAIGSEEIRALLRAAYISVRIDTPRASGGYGAWHDLTEQDRRMIRSAFMHCI
jgi:type I restriction enzyme R subunit